MEVRTEELIQQHWHDAQYEATLKEDLKLARVEAEHAKAEVGILHQALQEADVQRSYGAQLEEETELEQERHEMVATLYQVRAPSHGVE